MSTLHNSLEGLETQQARRHLEERIQIQSLRLHSLIQSLGGGNSQAKGMHPWTRPGLYIYGATNGGYDAWLRAHNGEVFALNLSASEFHLSTYAHNPATGYEVRLRLNPEGVKVLGFLDSDANAKAYVHAERTLRQAIHAIQTATPMHENATWVQSFSRTMEAETQLGINKQIWDEWTTRWGTEDMRSVLHLASSLADPLDDFQHWKDIVLSGWRSLEERGNAVNGPGMVAFTEF